jgi:hypothetical protein
VSRKRKNPTEEMSAATHVMLFAMTVAVITKLVKPSAESLTPLTPSEYNPNEFKLPANAMVIPPQSAPTSVFPPGVLPLPVVQPEPLPVLAVSDPLCKPPLLMSTFSPPGENTCMSPEEIQALAPSVTRTAATTAPPIEVSKLSGWAPGAFGCGGVHCNGDFGRRF